MDQMGLDSGLNNLLLLDRTEELAEAEVLYPFALEELLCKHVGEGGSPLVHLWRHPRAFVMGLRDSRLPGVAEAKQWLEAQGYSVAVRNSGGAAVPLDLGVVNVSLILPKRSQGAIDFHDDFERMYRLIGEALLATGQGVDKGEIQGAYCPGDYDLSIGGRKFCGIAQRRQAHAYVVQAFVVVTGSGEARGELAGGFYARAGGGVGAAERDAAARVEAAGTSEACAMSEAAKVEAERTKAMDYPRVTAGSMASLEELAGVQRPEDFIEAVKRAVRQRQTSDGMHAAAAGLWLPERGQVLEMVESLRIRYGIKDV
ncbi:lipoate--protein ligase family protein [Paenibacillus cremeus]|uniref:Lipoate--protein ligase family protein n=1 Tax=Paenibacillus cremeus TaxID=2163881 RepID=A0A559KIZ6_9BACL|nr:lipoate--protein ligase family protein [Paenibacillus cremeus]TVY12058.1 lipoate--protein ligase family protein [Paenibacillus cremeus]